MDNDFNKEIFTEEELNGLNVKLKEKENIQLPENLSAESMEAMLLNPQPKPEKVKKAKKSRKGIAGFVAFAASFAIIVTSLFIAKPWEKDKPSPNRLLPPEIAVAEDYSKIEAKFLSYADSYSKAEMYGLLYGYFTDDAAADVGVPEAGTGSSSTVVTAPAAQNTTSNSADKNHGETNEQVEGVSEADILKNDGEYLYVVNPTDYYYYGVVGTTVAAGGTDDAQEKKAEKPEYTYDCSIDIIKPSEKGELEEISTVEISVDDSKNISFMDIREMYISGNRLIAIVDCTVEDEEQENTYFYYYNSYRGLTMAVCFDLTDKENVTELWRVYQDGAYISSRLIGNQLVLLSEHHVDISQDDEDIVESCVPKTAQNDGELSRIACDCICIMEEINDTSYLVASTMNIVDSSTMETKAVLGGGSNVYCTTQTLYVTSTEYETKTMAEEVFGVTEQKTTICKFDITDGKIEYVNSCYVDGYALNQFSIDEYNGYLRIATTSGDWGDSLTNQVYVIDKDFKVCGKVENIAPGESIRSVRFIGNTGYVVTFMQTDPLFVIDFTDPQAPEMKGELKVTGFSSYLHPVGENLLLGIGPDGDENGTNNGMKVSLFDVSDPENPIEADKIVVKGINTQNRYLNIYSSCYSTHKAVCWNDAEKVMYIPYRKMDSIFTDTSYYSTSMCIMGVKVNESEKTLTTDGEYVMNCDDKNCFNGLSRVTYIEDIIIGFEETMGGLVAFDKKTQTLTDVIK